MYKSIDHLEGLYGKTGAQSVLLTYFFNLRSIQVLFCRFLKVVLRLFHTESSYMVLTVCIYRLLLAEKKCSICTFCVNDITKSAQEGRSEF